MNKIIKIEGDVILIGMENGTIKEVRREDCSNFIPNIGDIVELFNTETKVIVTKKEVVKPKESNIPAGGININLSNAQNTQTQQPAYYSNNVNLHAVNKIAYLVLALLLGGIGIHKFYAGYSGAGVMYLLFCWTGIPLILSLIDFIIGCCKPADINGTILV